MTSILLDVILAGVLVVVIATGLLVIQDLRERRQHRRYVMEAQRRLNDAVDQLHAAIPTRDEIAHWRDPK